MMDSKSLMLKLTELESYSDFLRNPENLGGKRGVYVWGFRFFDPKQQTTSKFIPYYVGKHRSNIHRRIQEHFLGIRSGTHKILFSDLLQDPQHYRSQEPSKHAFLNTDNTKRRKNSLSPGGQITLAPHVNAYLDNLFVTYIDISHLNLAENDDKTFVDRLERYVQRVIGDEKISSRTGITLPPDFRPIIVAGKDTEHILYNYPLS